MATVWEAVAAAGTDPDLLADLVASMADREAQVRACVATQLDAGAEPAVALRRAVPARRLDDGPARAMARAWRDRGVQVALLGDRGFPPRLATVADPPPFLATRGDPATGAGRAVVAVVGARNATAYGRGVAAWLAEAAAEAGAHVVSGGAVGIDAAAHGAAVDRPGGTTVVLGSGHDVAYPRAHAAPGGLFDRIVHAGGALRSELLPGCPPRAHRVRSRNRLVAGLADVVVVVEGGPRSGSLLTATAAVDRGVAVMAVPGDVRAPGSAAPHRLLGEGAVPCTAPADLLDALGVAAAGTPQAGVPRPAGPSVLPDPVRAVLAAAWPRPVALEELARRSGVAAGALLAALTRARVVGEIAQSVDGATLRRAP